MFPLLPSVKELRKLYNNWLQTSFWYVYQEEGSLTSKDECSGEREQKAEPTRCIGRVQSRRKV
jgi:hypothetical protein